MAKRALCVGINDYPYDDSDLNGCVNDAQAWYKLLTEQFDFPKTGVKLLTDAQATRKNIVSGLKALLKSAKKGDVLVFTNSSHGSYVQDQDGDEKFDEILCPYDVDTGGGILRDDDLRALFSAVPKGVHLTVISDSCFSGSVTRAAEKDRGDDRRRRFLSPRLRGEAEVAQPWKKLKKNKELYPESDMKEILLTGCSDQEFSYDALIGGTYHGAMTYHALQVIKAAKYKLTYAQLHDRMLPLIEKADFPQTPQLEGAAANKKRQIFA